jgi:hypothetical protein
LTIRPAAVPDLDVAQVAAAWERHVHERCPGQLPLATRLFERLAPERWSLEWRLPSWLGAAFGLDRAIADELVSSNVLGLGSIRLQDDLADGEVAPDEVAGARLLSAALYEAALDPYLARFDRDSGFWGRLDGWMAEWRAATERDGAARDDRLTARHDRLAVRDDRLAARAAPIRISAFAVCLLTDRAEAFPALDRCLDHALEAMVLYDDLADWEADLDAGRWNAFVASVSSGPQLAEGRDDHRRAILVALMATDALTSYVARIEEALERAVTGAEGFVVPVPALAAFLREYAADVQARATAWQAHYRDLGDRAAALLLQSRPDGRTWEHRNGTV